MSEIVDNSVEVDACLEQDNATDVSMGTKDDISAQDNDLDVSVVKDVTAVKEDAYAYLDREFSSEKFKIQLKNLPRFYGLNELRKLLNKRLKLNANKIKTIRRNSPFAFVCFRSDEAREKALKKLSNYMWKGKNLEVSKANPAPDPLVCKRQADAESDANPAKKAKLGTQEEQLKHNTIPLWNKEYSEQLKEKQGKIKQLLKKLGGSLNHFNRDLHNWLKKQKALYEGLPCELADIRFAEDNNGYRNKCEFTIGIDNETQLPTIGFRVGNYTNGNVGVAPVDNLNHIPDVMKFVVKEFQEYVRASDLQVFCPETQTGHFKQLLVRTAPNQMMVVVGVHPQDLSDEKLSELKKSLVEFFTEGEGKKTNVTSLYYQKLVKKRNYGDFIPSEHLWGDTHIFETVLGLKFRISPEAFFQTNTKGAEILFKSIIELAEPDDQSTVLDVCCGTGTIGLCFANRCKQVLGIEIVGQAVSDAKENAKLNNIENAEFFVGSADDLITNTCYRATGSNIIAVVDPPRAGLQKRALIKIRKTEKIKKFVYISCNPFGALNNFVDFGKPESKKLFGGCFVPTKAIPVDMFPYTNHCELIILFERWDNLNDEIANGREVEEAQNKEVSTEEDL